MAERKRSEWVLEIFVEEADPLLICFSCTDVRTVRVVKCMKRMLLPGRQDGAAEHERGGRLPKGAEDAAEMGPEGSKHHKNTGRPPNILSGTCKQVQYTTLHTVIDRAACIALLACFLLLLNL